MQRTKAPFRADEVGSLLRPAKIKEARAKLEKKDDIKRRLEEASKFAPLEQLALSPQCGFASTEEGNILSEEEQWAKLGLAVEIANEVWGK